MSVWKRNCETCDKKYVCASYDLTEDVFCDAWTGWIPATVATPDIDDYVLVQLTEEYAGEEKITTGMYFKEQVDDAGTHKKGEWLIGHISVLSVKDDEVYAWRPLPKPAEEKRLKPDKEIKKSVKKLGGPRRMTNAEKFKDWFDENKTELMCSKSFGVSYKDRVPFLCDNKGGKNVCEQCSFTNLEANCDNARKQWLISEINNTSLKEGDKLLVYDKYKDVWIKRYFYTQKGNRYFVFADGCDKFTTRTLNGHPVCEEYENVVPYIDKKETSRRKYLDELNISERPDKWSPEDHRQEKWAEERSEFGFDERETWSMDVTFYCWLYERVMFYKEHCNINLDYNKVTYNNQEYTQGELIDRLLEHLRFALTDKYWRASCNDDDINYVREIEKMWAVLLPSMWW